MQLTIYYSEDDKRLIEKLQIIAYARRQSVSQVILTALQEYLGATEESQPPSRPRARRGRRTETRAKP